MGHRRRRLVGAIGEHTAKLVARLVARSGFEGQRCRRDPAKAVRIGQIGKYATLPALKRLIIIKIMKLKKKKIYFIIPGT